MVCVVAGGRGRGYGGGGRGAEEEDVPQVQLPWRGPRRAARHVHRRPHPALPRARTAEVTTVPYRGGATFLGLVFRSDVLDSRRFQRGLKRKPMALIKKLRKAVGAGFVLLSLELDCELLGARLL